MTYRIELSARASRNLKRIFRHIAAGFKAGNLHHYWDTDFVDQLGPDAKAIASDLIGHISKGQVTQWRAGDVPA